MCDVHAYLLKNGHEEKVLESVERVEVSDSNIKLKNIFGEEKSVQAKFSLFDNNLQKILLQPV
ncbi:MAG TPA: CooT family nickel-binding protein [Desulfohalobiaceae bacterium]|nr:CooT family nickel-binding protein [Desulfohalobiaceae bacterium]